MDVQLYILQNDYSHLLMGTTLTLTVSMGKLVESSCRVLPKTCLHHCKTYFFNMAVLQPNVFLIEYISDFTQTSNGLTSLMP
jgi:hypothetical protein